MIVGLKEEQRGKEMLDTQTSDFDISMLVEKAQKGMKAENCSLFNKWGGWTKSDKCAP